MTQLFTVEIATGSSLEEIWPICTELAQKMAYSSFFCTGDWLEASTHSLSGNAVLLILIVKQGDTVRAILPLVGKRNLLGGRDLHFLGADFYPDPVGLICDSLNRADCVAVIKEFMQRTSGWDRLVLNWVLEDEVEDWRLSGKRISLEPFKLLPENFEDLLQTFKKKKRYNMRAGVRKILDAGAVLIKSTDTDTHKDLFENLCSLHQKRALERSLDSSFTGSKVENFHKHLVGRTDKARFYGLQMNNELIAVIYGYEFCNRFFYYQVAHNPDYKDQSPGSALLFLVIEDCCTRGVKEFNFLQGNESYKGVWTDTSRDLYRIVFNKGNLRSSVLNYMELGKSFIAGFIKRAKRGN